MSHGLSKSCTTSVEQSGVSALTRRNDATAHNALTPAPKRRPSLPPKLFLTPTSLSQPLQRNPTKLTPRPRQPIGHIAHRNSVVLRQFLVRNISIEIVGLEEPKRLLLALFHRMLAQFLHRQSN